MNRGQLAVIAARRWIGTPYHHQGSVRGVGADCLGLIRGVFAEVCGRTLEPPAPYSESWAEVSHTEKLFDAAKTTLLQKQSDLLEPGDVLLFRMSEAGVCKHLGIVAQAGARASFIHAYSRHGVLESSLSQPWRRRVAAIFTFPERIV